VNATIQRLAEISTSTGTIELRQSDSGNVELLMTNTSAREKTQRAVTKLDADQRTQLISALQAAHVCQYPIWEGIPGEMQKAPKMVLMLVFAEDKRGGGEAYYDWELVACVPPDSPFNKGYAQQIAEDLRQILEVEWTE
jgi:hypothetical protein